MKDNLYNVGILGFGKMGKVYAEAFERNPRTNVKYIYNHCAARKAEVTDMYPGTVFCTDWKAVIDDPSVDIVGICTPTNERISQITYALQKGKHVICEKAMCLDEEEALKIYEAAKESTGLLRVASELKFHPTMRRAKELLPSLGDILYVSYLYCNYREEVKWKHKLAAGGGILRELGGHFLDLMNDWLGEPVRVYGRNRTINPAREVEDMSITIIQYNSGTEVLMQCNYFDHRKTSYNFNIIGTRGQMCMEVSSYDTSLKDIILYHNDGHIEKIVVECPEIGNSIYPGHMDSYQREIDQFVCDIAEENRDLASVEQEILCIKTTLASYCSSTEHREVPLI